MTTTTPIISKGSVSFRFNYVEIIKRINNGGGWQGVNYM
jgi:hypothetical protein